jgi:AraC family transcriptional regulator
MSSMLHRPAADSDFCRHAYLEEPGDLAEEVSGCNLVADPAVIPQNVSYWISNIDSPLPYHITSAQDYTIAINIGPAFDADVRLAGEMTHMSPAPGGLFMLPAGCDMHVSYRGLKQYRFLNLACNFSRLEHAAISAGLSFPKYGLPPSQSAQADPQTLSLSQALIAELQSEYGMPLLVDTLTLALSVQVLRRMTATAIQPRRFVSGLAPTILRRVTDYMHEHLHDPLSLQALADVAGLSTYHFCRMFKQSTGMPPHQYLAHIRIERAKRMLLQTGLSIGDIAFDTGFGSFSQFSHVFKKQAHCTPLEYRRQGT